MGSFVVLLERNLQGRHIKKSKCSGKIWGQGSGVVVKEINTPSWM